MTLRAAFRAGLNAAKENLLPGLLLQVMMAMFIALYLLHDGTHAFLFHVANLREQMGYAFAFLSYSVSGGLLPELLKIIFFQKGIPQRRNVWMFATSAPLWGVMGMVVDFFYRSLSVWLGAGNSWQTVVLKVCVDQFLYSPLFANPVVAAYFTLRDFRFSREGLETVLRWDFLTNKVLPIQVAGWCIWIPGVAVVYSMPSLLQFPVAVLISCFWVLMVTTINERKVRH